MSTRRAQPGSAGSTVASQVASRVAASRRYRRVDAAVIERLVAEELRRSASPDEAVKRVKRRLHQAVGAFQPPVPEHRLAADVARLRAARDDTPEALQAACRELLARHTSTRERLPFLDRFYPALWHAAGGVPASILDLGCGVAPLALPWMDLPISTPYRAIDVDMSAVALVDAFLAMVGQPHDVEPRDLLSPATLPATDMAMLLKLVPILDRQEPDAARRILGSLPARHVAVSFPLRSLGGRSRGMETHLSSPGRRAAGRALGPRVRAVVEASSPTSSSCRETGARAGRTASVAEPLDTRRGPLAIPTFLPDATRAGVRGVSSEDLARVGVEAVMVNAFHLMRRPGARAVHAGGGIHRFMGWSGPIMSDSGGFQVWSLIRQDPARGVIRDREVIFREPYDRRAVEPDPGTGRSSCSCSWDRTS